MSATAHHVTEYGGKPMTEKRNLTDADVRALAAEISKTMRMEFAKKAGIGLFSLAWRGLFYVILGLAWYGYVHGHFPWSKP